jgi:hypothetical protein
VEKRKQRLLEEQRLLKKIRKTPRELEQEKRVEGLQTSLDGSNKVKKLSICGVITLFQCSGPALVSMRIRIQHFK